MGFVHGKNTSVSLDGKDLSAYTNTSASNRSADTHDITTYGKAAHVFQGGLKNGTGSIGGIYDNTALIGPAAVIKPLIGSTVQFIHRPDGVGAGKAQAKVDVVVNAYNESSPVADMVQWTAELTYSDAVNDGVQV